MLPALQGEDNATHRRHSDNPVAPIDDANRLHQNNRFLVDDVEAWLAMQARAAAA